MLFSQILASIRPRDKGWSGVIGEDWSQGRATFGGVVAALGNEAMRRLVPADRQLRQLDTIFVGPTLAGAVRIEAEVLRVGKAVTIASARLWSGEKVSATLTGIYGAARSTAISFPLTAATDVRRVEDLPDAATPDRAPSFLQHFDFRWAEGTRPFTGATLNRSKTYVRHKDTATFTESHMVALVDCIPSVILQMMNSVVPSSSLTWTLQFVRHDYSFDPDAWWRIDAQVDAAGSGYSCESCVLLNPSGAPAALSRQMVAVFG
ncbi:MAG TPA: thioesterase family protein [Steroidobacteraceae bacterium]